VNLQVDFDVVFGNTNIPASVMSDIAKELRKIGTKGTFYVGYPVMALSESSVTIDALLVSQKPGLVIFHIVRPGEDYRETQDRLYFAMESNLSRYESLRRGRSLGVPINVLSIFLEDNLPSDADKDHRVATLATIHQGLEDLKSLEDAELYRRLSGAIQRVSTIKPVKKRPAVVKDNSRGAKLKKIEREISNLDHWQRAAAIETPDGAQRIRGLAGSGKTVVLALKAAYLHTQRPEWKIAVTFHTRSLYQQFVDLIDRFTLEHMGDKPDPQYLHIAHSWGSSGQQGMYSIACAAINIPPTDYLTAKSRYGASEAFRGVCDELAVALKGKQLGIYDAILIDEAQDLPPSFFQIVDCLTKQPKRIIYAYDELQSLSGLGMSSPPDLFGHSMSLANLPDAPQQDIILPVCYRNTPWALTLAHALGLGLFRKAGLVQHFDDPNMWTEVGYIVESGVLEEGKEVTVRRGPGSYPHFFLDLIDPTDSVVSRRFDSRESQYQWIAQEVKKDIEDGELEPDDIMILLLNPITQRAEYMELRRHLEMVGVRSNLAGVTNDRDAFIEQGAVTVSGIYRAKGNEAPMVYIANAEHCATGHEMIRVRNMLFTAITRSRAWARICGVGEEMEILLKEIEMVSSAGYKLTFTIPTAKVLETVRRLNRDRTEREKGQIRKGERGIEQLLELVNEGLMTPEGTPKLQELLRAIEKRKPLRDDQ